ncbi:DUF4811 domain-containing protein [Fructobacillus fructosus]|uniref:DUF4811 domain-containing protein n=1 Tax=Fructobacillus fructosus TaxID=1631 RepID=UPI002DAFBED1|nr:hypothetical protein LMG30235_GOPAMIKF_01261 [Fructobacillus fructosus]CAK1251103.1 hypothetical protein LMG30234_GAICNKDF_01403 [Fructobacillus fructosus]CAK1251105.1 hypothetical protein R54866_LGPIEIPA_01399 [Fructobacillus fructosus]
MLIWIIAGLVFLAFVSWFFLKNRLASYLLGTTFSLLAVVLLSLNMSQHFGMEKSVTTTRHEVYSALPAQSPVKAVAVKKIGEKNYVLVYKNHQNDQQADKHFVPDTSEVVKAVKRSANYEKANVSKATVETKTVKWTYKSDLYRFLFKQKNEDNVVSIRHTLMVPENWQVIEK